MDLSYGIQGCRMRGSRGVFLGPTLIFHNGSFRFAFVLERFKSILEIAIRQNDTIVVRSDNF
jgi:hypothetical protein